MIRALTQKLQVPDDERMEHAMLGLTKQLVHMQQFLITWLIFFGFGVGIYALNAVRTKHKFSFVELCGYCLPFGTLSHQSFHIDIKIYLISKFTDKIFYIPGVFIGAFLCLQVGDLLKYTFPNYAPFGFSFIIAAICTLVMYFAEEFSYFTSHFALHKIPVLWELHKVHHSVQSLNPLTARRIHPLALAFEAVVRALFLAIPGGFLIFLFGITVTEALAVSLVASKIFLIMTLDPLKHSHHPIGLGFFDRVFISPHMHQMHHSKCPEHWDKNFGISLSIFDWMFGTAYRPARGEQPVYGLSGVNHDELKKHNTLYGAYVYPLVTIYAKGRKMLAGRSKVDVKSPHKDDHLARGESSAPAALPVPTTAQPFAQPFALHRAFAPEDFDNSSMSLSVAN